MAENRVDRLSTYIRTKLSRDPRVELLPTTSLIAGGLLDSLSLIQVLTFIEDEFGVVIPDEAATARSMDTLAAMETLIQRFEQ